MRWYLDTSAALKLLVDEAESEALAERIDEAEPGLVARSGFGAGRLLNRARGH